MLFSSSIALFCKKAGHGLQPLDSASIRLIQHLCCVKLSFWNQRVNDDRFHFTLMAFLFFEGGIPPAFLSFCHIFAQ